MRSWISRHPTIVAGVAVIIGVPMLLMIVTYPIRTGSPPPATAIARPPLTVIVSKPAAGRVVLTDPRDGYQWDVTPGTYAKGQPYEYWAALPPGEHEVP